MDTRYWTIALHSSNAQNPEAKTKSAGAAPQTARRAAIHHHATAAGSHAMAPPTDNTNQCHQFINTKLAQHHNKRDALG